jgi:hypothetical protein
MEFTYILGTYITKLRFFHLYVRSCKPLVLNFAETSQLFTQGEFLLAIFARKSASSDCVLQVAKRCNPEGINRSFGVDGRVQI